MTAELHRAFTSLGKPGAAGDDKQLPPYFLSYSVSDASMSPFARSTARLADSSASHMRMADVQVRVGDPKLDNTHGNHRGSAVNSLQLPLGDDREALARSLWLATNTGYGNALDNYLRVKTEAQVRAKEEDTSPDFSQEAPQISHRSVGPARRRRPRRRGNSACGNSPASSANTLTSIRTWSCSPCKTRPTTSPRLKARTIVTPHLQARVVVAVAVTRADDGMDLFREQTFEAETVDGLPSQADLEAAMRDLGKSLEALRKAPVTEPFDGPAILSGRAAAVFFHEVLGHRLEGQRQRGDEEGQTFTKDLGKEVLPTFLSVADDPTMTTFGKTWLSGSYQYDDEGQKAERVDLIQDGVLKTFLMSRLPIASFSCLQRPRPR